MSITPFVPSFTISLLPRGNLFRRSQTFDNAAWVKTGGTVTPNTAADICGLTTADTWARNTAGASFIGEAVTLVPGVNAYTFSIYAQLISGNFISLDMNGTTGRADVCFNLATGAISLGPSATSDFTLPSATITPLAGGWFRLTLTATTDGENLVNCYASVSTVSQVVDGTGSASPASCFLWGAQLEEYAQASAYAATVATADPGIWAGVQSLPVLPYLPGQQPSVSKGPTWSTQVVRAASGRDRRTAYYPFPIWNFELQYEVIRHRLPTQDELADMWEFFNIAQGQFGSWLFVDPSDCYIPFTAPVNFGTGDGATTTFQLSRQINSFAEPVFDVYQPIILDNGVTTAATLTFSANGQVTFGSAPANGHALTWFGYFYFGCRFTTDDMTFEQIVQALWLGKSVKFESIRP